MMKPGTFPDGDMVGGKGGSFVHIRFINRIAVRIRIKMPSGR
jgi:hypothetical protein